MKTLVRNALSISVAATFLAGCGGLSPIGVPRALQQSRVFAPPSANSNAVSANSPYRVLYSFAWGTSDGSEPTAGLTGVNGTLYGTTEIGGGGCKPYGPGCGTVYSVSTTGVENVLHSFRHHPNHLYTDAAFAGLIDVKGTLYGTTAGGGERVGTVFSIGTTGQLKILHVFSGACGYTDGFSPQAGLIDVEGTLYGTTYFGGSCKDQREGFGTVYSISTTGQERVVYRFRGKSDGANPQAGLIDVNGTLYGTTVKGGGTGCFGGGCGTVYSISRTGKEKVLHRFQGSDGANPQAGLIGVNGTLYGTTANGGSTGAGTVYTLRMTGKEQVLYSFRGDTDGAQPEAALIDVNGTLYGTTSYGCISYSSQGCGTVFTISTTGSEKVLHEFAGSADGAAPKAALVNVKGRLYGTTSLGGAGGGGTVFTLSP
ncbi:MAG: choice-of-anchor tandem repeat GloVer-containing protein [Candidatus Cybelea sp.]